MSWLQNVMAGDSQIKQELVELAERVHDQSLTPRERLDATWKMGLIVQSGEQLQSMIDELEEPVDDEPKYVWRNGAKVKVS